MVSGLKVLEPKVLEKEKEKEKVETQKNPMNKKPIRKGNAKGNAKEKAKPIIYKKKKISQALREQVWLARFGRVFEHKCYVTWCRNTITVFDFESGHNIPESKGGSTDLTNLFPICRKCNGSMGDRYSIDEWNVLHTPIGEEISVVTSVEEKSPTERNPKKNQKKGWRRFFCWVT